ncbi:pyridoxal phosphate-dependent aminotransferase [Candidatus Sulfidibacterium hydrothermale]|uniref:pyridoxal phosphate-dependent aminotransferase n=1 Tax=Candidatus Sulfidibacterium hydrothermale TaxID=2875962 RepID=UPI001F0A9382|nr:pyridoxal phosphate-dependent aminotransferase [Candidatus Sulfidibacterium hydrothermale]
MTRRSRELKAKGIDVINLSIGEPDFNTPDPVKAAAKEAIDNNITHYPPVAGFRVLQEAIAEKLERDNGLHFSPEQIVVSNGAKQALANIFLSILDPGDEVILTAPYWVSYADIIQLAGGKVNALPTGIEEGFKLRPERLEKAINEKTKAFLFNSPSNPTGMVYSRDEMAALVNVLKKYPDILIISDEIYEHIHFSGTHISMASFPEVKDQTVVVNGVSKCYAMTGWRIGYMAGPLFLAKACSKLQGQYTSGPGTISQMAALKAIQNPPQNSEYIQEMVSAFQKRRDMLVEKLNEIPDVKTYMPEGAFYLFPDISAYFGKTDGKTVIRNATDLSLYLLEKAHVALVTGEAFGDANCVRISYATSSHLLLEAVKRIKKALSELN